MYGNYTFNAYLKLLLATSHFWGLYVNVNCLYVNVISLYAMKSLIAMALVQTARRAPEYKCSVPQIEKVKRIT